MYIFNTWVPSNPIKQDNNDIDHLPVEKILQLERAFLEYQKSEFEEFNDYPNCSFVSDKKQKDVEEK